MKRKVIVFPNCISRGRSRGIKASVFALLRLCDFSEGLPYCKDKAIHQSLILLTQLYILTVDFVNEVILKVDGYNDRGRPKKIKMIFLGKE